VRRDRKGFAASSTVTASAFESSQISALKVLDLGSAIEFGQILLFSNLSCLYPTYVRD
jgi:hypothetical protein